MKCKTLKNSSDFNYIYKNSYRYRSDFLDICILKSGAKKYFYARGYYKHIIYYGLSVSKKVGKAVVRNKIKRQLRETIREIIKISTNLFIILIPKTTVTFHEYRNKIVETIIKHTQNK